MSSEENVSGFVQLGLLEVDCALLDEAGDFLDTFTNNLLLHPAFVSDRSLTVPLMGWRVILDTEAGDGVEAQRIIAAPHPTTVDAWVMAARIASEDGFATYRYDPEPTVPVPPKSQRRAGLRLEWPDDHDANDELGALHVVLVNASTTQWTPTAQDDFFVTGVIETDADRTEVVGGGFFAYIAGSPEAVSLRPGQRLLLPVDLEQGFLDQLNAGRYFVTATLVSLELNSPETIATKH